MSRLLFNLAPYHIILIMGYLALLGLASIGIVVYMLRRLPKIPVEGGLIQHVLAFIQRFWPPSIRLQLTLVYAFIMTLILPIAALATIGRIQHTLVTQINSEQETIITKLAKQISDKNSVPTIEDTATFEQAQHTNGIGGLVNTTPLLIRLRNVNGTTVYTNKAYDQSISTLPESQSELDTGASEIGFYDSAGKLYHFYTVTLADNGTIYGTLQVGENRNNLTDTETAIIFITFLLLPFLWLVGFVGCGTLASRALRPIHRLAQTARTLDVHDLKQRIPVPATRDDIYYMALMFNNMLERLDAAFTIQRRFVSDASHELRTPVAVIRSMTDVALLEERSTTEYIELLHDINAEAERLTVLINQLLMLAREDDGRMALELEPIRLDLLALDTVTSMQPLAEERGITLKLGNLMPVKVNGDTPRLIQVIMGLVDNALTYTPACGTVIVEVMVYDQTAKLMISDTGIGIAPDDLPHIFERFYRADRARSQAHGGSGLGLALAMSIIRAHKGEIAVESELNKGSIFSVTLPVIVSLLQEAPMAQLETPTVSLPDTLSTTKKKLIS
jgi:two-component system, OmpR family, sensor kinase